MEFSWRYWSKTKQVMICWGRVSLAKAKVWYSARQYNSESKLTSQSTDLVLQPQAPIQGLFHGQFQVNWLLLGTFGNRFVFCLQDQPQSQFRHALMHRDINTHFSPWNHCQQTLSLYRPCIDCLHWMWCPSHSMDAGICAAEGSFPSLDHYSSALWLHVEVFSSFLH